MSGWKRLSSAVDSSLFLLLVLIWAVFSFLLTSAFAEAAETPEEAAESSYNLLHEKWLSSKDAYEQHLTQPLFGGGNVPLKSLDESQNGTVSLMCPGTDFLFQVLIQPAETGDLNFIQVAYDSDLNGDFESHYEVSGPISGVCSNGFIKCDEGTWNNCHFYRWSYTNGTLSSVEVPLAELGGCYCINSSCGVEDFLPIKDTVLQSIGGGIASAMVSDNPLLSLIDIPIVYFFLFQKDISFL